MELFKLLEQYDYEQVVFCQDANSGLKAIISIHDTTLGPALGGLRMWNYQTEEEALIDALRLSRGMTYKNALAGLNLGGGKSVLIGNAKTDKTEAMFRSFGRYVESLNGRYITAEDVGTSEQDMDIIHQETNFVTGISPAFGSGGNPSPVTAYGVYQGMKASAKVVFGTDSLEGKIIAVQGIGNVSYALCEYLHKEGAKLIVTDINEESVKRAVASFGAKAVDPKDIFSVNCDIFSPNALGAIVNDETLPLFKCKLIAGAANNQLKEERHGDELNRIGIAYAPDYAINAGGVINVADELQAGGYVRERALKKVEGIYETMTNIFALSAEKGIPTYKAADLLAERRIDLMKNTRSTFLPKEKNILEGRK